MLSQDDLQMGFNEHTSHDSISFPVKAWSYYEDTDASGIPEYVQHSAGVVPSTSYANHFIPSHRSTQSPDHNATNSPSDLWDTRLGLIADLCNEISQPHRWLNQTEARSNTYPKSSSPNPQYQNPENPPPTKVSRKGPSGANGRSKTTRRKAQAKLHARDDVVREGQPKRAASTSAARSNDTVAKTGLPRMSAAALASLARFNPPSASFGQDGSQSNFHHMHQYPGLRSRKKARGMSLPRDPPTDALSPREGVESSSEWPPEEHVDWRGYMRDQLLDNYATATGSSAAGIEQPVPETSRVWMRRRSLPSWDDYPPAAEMSMSEDTLAGYHAEPSVSLVEPTSSRETAYYDLVGMATPPTSHNLRLTLEKSPSTLSTSTDTWSDLTPVLSSPNSVEPELDSRLAHTSGTCMNSTYCMPSPNLCHQTLCSEESTSIETIEKFDQTLAVDGSLITQLFGDPMFDWRGNHLDETLSNQVDAAMANFQSRTSGHDEYLAGQSMPVQATFVEGLTTEALEKQLESIVPQGMEPLQFNGGSQNTRQFTDDVLAEFPDSKLTITPAYGSEEPHISISNAYAACSPLASSSGNTGTYEQANYDITDYMQLQSHFMFDTESKAKCSYTTQSPAHTDVFENATNMDVNRLRKVAKLNRNRADQVFDIRRGGDEAEVNANPAIGGMAGFADMSSPYFPSSPL